MRSHGLPQFPDPGNHGTSLRVGPVDGVDPGSPQYQAAQASCGSFLPGGGPTAPTITPADKLDYLKAAACMRTHGIAGFPDPTITSGRVKFVVPAGIDATSSRFLAAEETCRKLIPAGLSYSQ
jgi:hypothetical protein